MRPRAGPPRCGSRSPQACLPMSTCDQVGSFSGCPALVIVPSGPGSRCAAGRPGTSRPRQPWRAPGAGTGRPEPCRRLGADAADRRRARRPPRRTKPAAPRAARPRSRRRQPAAPRAGAVPPDRRVAAPPSSPPLVRFIELAFPTQGNQSVIDPQTYLYYIQTQIVAALAAGVWIPYNERPSRRCSRTSSASGARTSSTTSRSTCVDDSYPNGVDRQAHHLQHGGAPARQDRRLPGTKKVEQSKIDEKLKEEGVTDPPRLVHRPEHRSPRSRAIVRGMMAEKGYQFAKVTHEIERCCRRPEAGAPHVPHRRRAEGPHPEDRLHRQQGR